MLGTCGQLSTQSLNAVDQLRVGGIGEVIWQRNPHVAFDHGDGHQLRYHKQVFW